MGMNSYRRRPLSDVLLVSAGLTFCLAEIVTLFLAFAYWGPGGILVALLGPIGSVLVTVFTGMSGPVFWLVVSVVLYWLGQKVGR
jgi:membrane protein implicated in regulation of membrane protease activity